MADIITNKQEMKPGYYLILPNFTFFIGFPSEILQRTFTSDLHLLLKWLLPLLERDNITVEHSLLFIFILYSFYRRQTVGVKR